MPSTVIRNTAPLACLTLSALCESKRRLTPGGRGRTRLARCSPSMWSRRDHPQPASEARRTRLRMAADQPIGGDFSRAQPNGGPAASVGDRVPTRSGRTSIRHSSSTGPGLRTPHPRCPAAPRGPAPPPDRPACGGASCCRTIARPSVGGPRLGSRGMADAARRGPRPRRHTCPIRSRSTRARRGSSRVLVAVLAPVGRLPCRRPVTLGVAAPHGVKDPAEKDLDEDEGGHPPAAA